MSGFSGRSSPQNRAAQRDFNESRNAGALLNPAPAISKSPSAALEALKALCPVPQKPSEDLGTG